jgi:hypothetical protein
MISMGPKTPEMSERPLKTMTRFPDFQAEYEGSIPFNDDFIRAAGAAARCVVGISYAEIAIPTATLPTNSLTA